MEEDLRAQEKPNDGTDMAAAGGWRYEEKAVYMK